MSASPRTLEPDLQAPPVDDRVGPGDGLFHLYCCEPDRALCGSSLAGVPEGDGSGEVSCAVCFELADGYEGGPCPRCPGGGGDAP